MGRKAEERALQRMVGVVFDDDLIVKLQRRCGGFLGLQRARYLFLQVSLQVEQINVADARIIEEGFTPRGLVLFWGQRSVMLRAPNR